MAGTALAWSLRLGINCIRSRCSYRPHIKRSAVDNAKDKDSFSAFGGIGFSRKQAARERGSSAQGGRKGEDEGLASV